ncbi:hypothetical protein [uncultured Microbulbifer sp.]|uniref:hypothetical protein n=1 Tax=uncultured Microbulbifer sp. TaxID=348147 RepID=UPI002630DAC8|nr:hypothetical protein [uncultured Microbulbifer sp.]
MNEQEVGSATVTVMGVGLTQTPATPLQVLGVVIATLGLVWNVYAVITRNRHNKFVREQAKKSAPRPRRDQ